MSGLHSIVVPIDPSARILKLKVQIEAEIGKLADDQVLVADGQQEPLEDNEVVGESGMTDGCTLYILERDLTWFKNQLTTLIKLRDDTNYTNWVANKGGWADLETFSTPEEFAPHAPPPFVGEPVEPRRTSIMKRGKADFLA